MDASAGRPRGNESQAEDPAPDLPAIEAALRERLAGDEPIGPALELAVLLGELERHSEAVAVLQEAQRRAPDPRLSIAIAGVQRDLGQRHLAVAELRAVRRELGALTLHPAVLRDLAELEWLEGDREDAAATLAELRRVHGSDPWLAEHQEALQVLGNDIARNDAPTRIAERDLLGNLRGAPVPTVRLKTLEALMQRARRAPQTEHQHEIERKLLAIAGGDESPTLRARALQLGPVTGEDAGPFCAAGLLDASPMVRQVAAERARETLGAGAAPLLLRALADEVDDATRQRLQAELDLAQRATGAAQEER